MAQFRKKPVVIEATQWFKNGDHPNDYAKDQVHVENNEPRTFTGAERKAKGWEGSVVRYFRRPDVDGKRGCQHCSHTMHEHGWIDTLEGGHVVCPGDFIITGVKGELYPCKPAIFEATYDDATAAPSHGIEGAAELSEAAKSLRESIDELRCYGCGIVRLVGCARESCPKGQVQ